MGAERDRVPRFTSLDNGLRAGDPWYRWGPYLRKRQRGTVREDYSADGEAWTYLPHDRARSQAHRWGEDGLAGFSDVEQRGFTLVDLVSYDSKHNEANGDGNHDGADDNRSWNCGVEGPTTGQGVLALRARQQRALLTTLMLSFGVPMLLGGDELGRTILVLINGWWEPLDFVAPPTDPGQVWEAEIDTYSPSTTTAHGKCGAGETLTAGPRSVVVLRGQVVDGR